MALLNGSVIKVKQSKDVEGVKIDRMRVPFVFICENNSKAPYEFVDIDSEIPIMKHRQIEQ